MKLNKKEFCAAVDTYKSMLEEENKLIDALDISPEWTPGEWINNYYELLFYLCELEDDSIYGTVLDWFCFETHFGEDRDNKIYDGKKEWTINSPEILYDYIMEVEN